MQAYRSQQVHPKKCSEYLSSGEEGQSNIVLLAKKAGSSDTRATRVVQLTARFKYQSLKNHAMALNEVHVLFRDSVHNGGSISKSLLNLDSSQLTNF